MARHPLGTGKAAKKRREQLLLRLGVGGAIFFVVSIGLLLALRHASIVISDIHIEGHQTLEESVIREIVEKELVGSYGLVIPRSSAFFYPAEAIRTSLTTTHKRIKQVHIERQSLTALTVRITEREPEALWCTDDEASCHFMDESGYIFASSPLYSGNPYVLFKGLLVEEPVGMQYVPEDEFSFIVYILSQFTRLSLKTRAVTMTTDELSIELMEGGSIRLVRAGDFDAALLALETTLLSESFKKHSLSELEYLDLRFANKAVVKWRVGESEETTIATSSQAVEIQ
jgi:cell division septal protein FtsQ